MESTNIIGSYYPGLQVKAYRAFLPHMSEAVPLCGLQLRLRAKLLTSLIQSSVSPVNHKHLTYCKPNDCDLDG